MGTRRVAAVVLALAVVTLGSGCTKTAAVQNIGLYYGHGPLEGNHFERVILPGSGAQLQGFFDTIAWLPINQRNYIVSKHPGEGDRSGTDVIRVPAKGGVNMDFEVSVYFKLNTHSDDIKGFKGGTLRRFYEQICKKYDCASDDGWDRMLNDNFRKIIETSMRERVFTYTVDELFANAVGEASGHEDAIRKIQVDIAATLKENISRVLGGQYFCGPTFDRDKEACPDFEFIINSAEPSSASVRNSFDAVRAATNEANAAKARAEGQAASQAASQRALTPEYLRFLEIQATQKCAESPNCTLVVSSGGTNVNVTPQR
jgi:regulator of protease activity HflC (stomatin/prohibitin superfamily)